MANEITVEVTLGTISSEVSSPSTTETCVQIPGLQGASGAPGADLTNELKITGAQVIALSGLHNTLSGNLNSSGAFIEQNSGNLLNTGLVVQNLSGSLLNTGQTLETKISQLSGNYTFSSGEIDDLQDVSGVQITGRNGLLTTTGTKNTFALSISGYSTSGQLQTTGQTLELKLNQLSGISVLDSETGHLAENQSLLNTGIAVNRFSGLFDSSGIRTNQLSGTLQTQINDSGSKLNQFSGNLQPDVNSLKQSSGIVLNNGYGGASIKSSGNTFELNSSGFLRSGFGETGFGITGSGSVYTYIINNRFYISGSGGGGAGNPGGNDRELQYNDGGSAFGASPNLVFDVNGNFLLNQQQVATESFAFFMS